MNFPNFRTNFEETKKLSRSLKNDPVRRAKFVEEIGFDPLNRESVYEYDIDRGPGENESINPTIRKIIENAWYEIKRPYFNVYPSLEKKFYHLKDSISLSELSLPYSVIEVRTSKLTSLLWDGPEAYELTLVVDMGDEYQQATINKDRSISNAIEEFSSDDERLTKARKLTDRTLLDQVIFLVAGTCMIANDKSVVSPVVLNKHRKPSMTEAELTDYGERAVKRTGRIGFDIGRDLERMKATAHYRNGCLAKYYVSKDHDAYPANAEGGNVPIIKWRSGAVVNRDNVPSVPTGFKDKAK